MNKEDIVYIIVAVGALFGIIGIVILALAIDPGSRGPKVFDDSTGEYQGRMVHERVSDR